MFDDPGGTMEAGITEIVGDFGPDGTIEALTPTGLFEPPLAETCTENVVLSPWSTERNGGAQFMTKFPEPGVAYGGVV
jgi:hypothetical protein